MKRTTIKFSAYIIMRAAVFAAVLSGMALADMSAVEAVVKVACVGDSITYGAGIKNREKDTYPAHLQSLLGEKWQVINCGKNGATMMKNTGRPIWKESVFQQAVDSDPDIVIIMLGTNDAALQDIDKLKAEYAADCGEMVDMFLGLPGKPRVWLCRPVPLIAGRQDDRMNNLKNVVTPIVGQIAKEKGVGLIDMYAVLENRPELFPDKVHPDEEGAALIAGEVYRAITGKQPPMPEMIDIGSLVAFGDSTTALRGELEVYSQILQKELPANQIKVNIINAGIPGNNTSQARERFEKDVLSKKPDMVVIQFGINDSMTDVWKDPPADTPRVALTKYEQNLTYFVKVLKQQGIPVILMTPNPLRWTDRLKELYGKPPYDINDPDGLNVILKDYAQSVRNIAAEEKVPVVDIYTFFQNYGKVKYQSVDELLSDGMHPNQTGQRIVAYRLRKQIEAMERNK